MNYQIVEAESSVSCAGVGQAVERIPKHRPFMLIWSDLILPEKFELPKEYQEKDSPQTDYIGISGTFPCRWSYDGSKLLEERPYEHGVASCCYCK